MNEQIIDFTLSSSSTMIELTVVTGMTKTKNMASKLYPLIFFLLIGREYCQAGEALNRIPGYQQIGNSPSIRGGSGGQVGRV